MKSETEQELSNIVAFPSSAESPKDNVNFLMERGQFCLHPGYLVNEHDRQIKCRKCGAIIEPFDLLLDMARKETNLANNVTQLRKEESQRRANIQKLIQIERNAKSRIRRAGHKGKLPDWQFQEVSDGR